VRTTQGEERARATRARQVEHARSQWEQARWHLSNQRFACVPDARAALTKQLKTRPAWLQVERVLVMHPRHRRPGRPRKDASPDQVDYQLLTTLSVDEAALARQARRQAAFLVATHVRDPAQLSAAELIRTDTEQQSVEIVCSQMTKTDLLAGWSGGDHVVDLHVGAGDDHAVNQECDELPLLLPGRLGEACSHRRTKRFHGLHDAGQVLLAACFRLKVVHLSRHCLKLLLDRQAPALILFQGHHLVQVGIRQALSLAL
jgi:hypothetical protein